MSSRRFQFTAIVAVAVFAPTVAFAAPEADSPWRQVGGEADWALQVGRSSSSGLSRTEVQAQIARTPTVSGDWRASDGEGGWALDGARYEISGGKLVHASDCNFKPAVARAGGRSFEPLPSFYQGA